MSDEKTPGQTVSEMAEERPATDQCHFDPFSRPRSDRQLAVFSEMQKKTRVRPVTKNKQRD